MALNDGEHSADCDCQKHDGELRGEGDMTAERLALLRHRAATRFYDDPRVIEQIARAILRESR